MREAEALGIVEACVLRGGAALKDRRMAGGAGASAGVVVSDCDTLGAHRREGLGSLMALMEKLLIHPPPARRG